jgi:hypothetical protein
MCSLFLRTSIEILENMWAPDTFAVLSVYSNVPYRLKYTRNFQRSTQNISHLAIITHVPLNNNDNNSVKFCIYSRAYSIAPKPIIK